MAVKGSPEAIRQMKSDIQSTISDIQRISEGIRTGMSSTANWDDTQATQFNMIMQRVARLTEAPVDTLQRAIPKLESLAQALDAYNSVHFG